MRRFDFAEFILGAFYWLFAVPAGIIMSLSLLVGWASLLFFGAKWLISCL